MKCPNCGEEIPNGSKFCGFCGYQLSDEELKQNNGSNNVLNNITNIIKNTDKKVLGIGALVVCLVIGLVVFFTTRKPTIDLQDYLTVEISGADGYGRAEVDFDYDQFEWDIIDAIGLSDISQYLDYDLDELQYAISSDDYSKLISCMYAVESFDYEVDVTSGLSNGDKVTVTFTFNNDLASEAGFKFKGNDYTVKVSDLGELEAIDPFEGVTIDYTGVSPSLVASINTDGANDIVKNYVSFSLSKDDDITIGDTITLSVANYEEDEFANNYGVILSETTKEYVCEDAYYYTTSASEITDDFLTEVKTADNETLSADKTSYTNENITYEGYFFLYLNDMADYSSLYGRFQNKLYLVYSATVISTDGSFADMKVYYLLGPKGVKTNKSTGENSADLDYLTYYGDKLKTIGSYTITGYESLSDAKEDINDDYGEYYTIETVDLD